MKGEIKCTHLCEWVLKWSQETTKEVDLMHVLPGGEPRTFELVQIPNIPRTLQEHLQLSPVMDFCLATALANTYVLPRLVFCLQHQSKFLVNNAHKHSLFVFKNSRLLLPNERLFGLLPESVLPMLQF